MRPGGENIAPITPTARQPSRFTASVPHGKLRAETPRHQRRDVQACAAAERAAQHREQVGERLGTQRSTPARRAATSPTPVVMQRSPVECFTRSSSACRCRMVRGWRYRLLDYATPTTRWSPTLSLFTEACKVIPGGVNSPVRAFRGVGGEPIFFESGQGPHVWSADGRQFIDYVGSWGPMILGHARPGGDPRGAADGRRMACRSARRPQSRRSSPAASSSSSRRSSSCAWSVRAPRRR